MMANDEASTYQVETVKVLRGREKAAIAAREADGWELVSTAQGALRTELTFKRQAPKRKDARVLVGMGAFGIILIAIIAIGAFNERGADQDADHSAAQPVQSSPQPVESPTASATSEPTPTTASPDVLTSSNNADLAAVLVLTDYCDPAIGAFAVEHQGELIAIDASVDALGFHGNYATRYDILLSVGDFSETSSIGPAFQFRDVNTTHDLQIRGDAPGTIGVGDNVHVIAEVLEYESSTCLFLLEPVETRFR